MRLIAVSDDLGWKTYIDEEGRIRWENSGVLSKYPSHETIDDSIAYFFLVMKQLGSHYRLVLEDEY